MAQNPDLETNVWLTWKTAIPFLSKPCRSSNFSLLDTEWNLEFTFGDYPIGYAICLHQISTGESLHKTFEITTFIRHPKYNWEPLLSQHTTVKNTNAILWKGHDKNELFKTIPWFYVYGELKIDCLFHGVPPSMHQTKNERMHLSTQKDLDLLASPNVLPDLETLSLDFCNLLEDEAFPDVKLKCGDRTFSVHRSILAARSQVFSSRFRNKISDKETNIAYVTDLDADILELLLKYIYSGKIPDLSEDTALSLYTAGEKYAVHALKRTCLDWTTRCLTEENCVGFLTTAEEHGNVAFKHSAISFICEHQAVLTSENWLKFAKEHSKLALQIYHKFVASKTEV